MADGTRARPSLNGVHCLGRSFAGDVGLRRNFQELGFHFAILRHSIWNEQVHCITDWWMLFLDAEWPEENIKHVQPGALSSQLKAGHRRTSRTTRSSKKLRMPHLFLYNNGQAERSSTHRLAYRNIRTGAKLMYTYIYIYFKETPFRGGIQEQHPRTSAPDWWSRCQSTDAGRPFSTASRGFPIKLPTTLV